MNKKLSPRAQKQIESALQRMQTFMRITREARQCIREVARERQDMYNDAARLRRQQQGDVVAAQSAQAVLDTFGWRIQDLATRLQAAQQEQHELEEWIHVARLSAAEYAYVKLRYFEGASATRVAMTLSYSERSCCRLRSNALEKLARVQGWRDRFVAPAHLPPAQPPQKLAGQ